MTDEEIIKLNRIRMSMQLKPLLNQIPEDQHNILTKLKITKDGTPIKLKDINFAKSNIFICSVDILGALGVYGLQLLNGVLSNDISKSGHRSRIRTSYMSVNSPDVKYARLPMEYEYIADCEEYQSISYLRKDVILWRLFKDSGMGDNTTMYRVTASLIEEREYLSKLNWIFFIGTLEELNNTYQFNLPNISIYEIKLTGTISMKGDLF